MTQPPTQKKVVNRRLFTATLCAAAAVGNLSVGAATHSAGAPLTSPVHPEDFATKSRSITQSFQMAVDHAAAHGLPLQLDSTYDVDFPIYVPSGSIWRGRGKIRNVFSGTQNVRKLCILPGNYSPSHYSELAYLPCDAVGAGQHNLQLRSSKNFSALAAGDLVFIRSSRFYKGFGNVVLPLYGSMNMVKSVTLAGTVELEYPIVEAVPDLYIAKAETSIWDIFNRRTLYCCYKARIDGISLESVSGNALERGGFLGCDFKFSGIAGLTGIFTNAVCFSRIRVDSILCDRKIIDLAGCSVGSHLEVGTATYSKTQRSADEVLIALNENALRNKLSIHSVHADGFDYRSQGLIQLGACAGNRVDIHDLSASGGAGSAVIFINVARLAPGETQSVTMDNVVLIDHIKGGDAMERFGLFVDAGGKNQSNTLEIKRTKGRVSAAAVTVAGKGHVIKGQYVDGPIALAAATGCTVDVEAPHGVTGVKSSALHRMVRVNGSLI